MKPWFWLIFRLLCCAAWLISPLPGAAALPPEDVEVMTEAPRDDFSPAEAEALWARIRANSALLHSLGGAAPAAPHAVTYIYPVRLIPGLADFYGTYISALPDHNPASGAVRDYNGGTRTYDGHQGTDIVLSPFKWNKMNAGEVQVIAAAAGKIVIKENLFSADHNCSINSPGNGGNVVALEHADGRMTLYAHLRYNSLTAKTLGQNVEQGEYLGLVGSSGTSTGPHLHFEVRAASGSAAWIDPFAGPYSQPESLWANQLAYMDTGVNRLTSGTADPVTNGCASETTHLQDSFTAPVLIYFYSYFRDYQNNLPLVLNLYRPDGSLRRTQTYHPADGVFYTNMWLRWKVDLSASDPAGTWRFEAVYNGQAYSTFFNLNAPTQISLNSPDGGEQWEQLRTHPVAWADNLGGAVNLTLYQNGVPVAELASSIPSSGAYAWRPGLAVAPGSGYSLRVTSVIHPALFDQSSAPFSILPGPQPHTFHLPLIQR